MMTAGEQLQDVTKTYLPILVVVALIGAAFAIGSSYREITAQPEALSSRMTTLEAQRKQDMADINAALKSFSSSLDELRKAITDPLNSRLPVDLVRQSDLKVFCLEMQVNNPDKNFKCPAMYSRN